MYVKKRENQKYNYKKKQVSSYKDIIIGNYHIYLLSNKNSKIFSMIFKILVL